MAKRNPIIKYTGIMTVTKTVTYPIWKVHADDTQAVRFNTEKNEFEFSYDPADDEWEPMEWKYWLGSEINPISKKEILETLTHLTTLLKATK